MKTMILLTAMVLSSCAILKEPGLLPEDELFQTRKYVGLFLDYELISPAKFGSAPVMLVRTEMPHVYNGNPTTKIMNILIYSRRCDYDLGDKIYIRRMQIPINSLESHWVYYLECDGNPSYKLRQFEFDNKLLVQSWF